jgi:creatinine amidohydrolase
MDMGHLKAIAGGLKKSRRKGIHAYEPLSKYFYSQASDKEVHADIRETSFIMSKYPHLLDRCYKTLPPVISPDFAKPKALIKTIKELGAEEGYIGSPAKASSDCGDKLLKDAAQFCAQCALKLHRGAELPELPARIRWLMRLS